MDITEAKALPREKKLLLVTCNTFESQAVAKFFGHRGVRQQVHADAHVYTYLGRHGDYEVFNVVAPTQGPYGASHWCAPRACGRRSFAPWAGNAMPAWTCMR